LISAQSRQPTTAPLADSTNESKAESDERDRRGEDARADRDQAFDHIPAQRRGFEPDASSEEMCACQWLDFYSTRAVTGTPRVVIPRAAGALEPPPPSGAPRAHV
jgi:hypothetical protein